MLGGVGLIGYWGLKIGCWRRKGGGEGMGGGDGEREGEGGISRRGGGDGEREEERGKRGGGGGGRGADGCSRRGYLKSEMTAATGDFGRRRLR